jgi:quinol monooxygenase YgiN
MIVIAGQIDLDPAQRAAAVAAALAVMEATRHESGCLSYTFSADLSDPGRFFVFEEWESAEALAAHFQTPHMATFQQQMGGFGIRGTSLQRYEIASVGPLR